MVIIALLSIVIRPETFLLGIIIVMDSTSHPSMTFDPEMVVTFLYQVTVARTALQNTLSQCDACGNLVLQHLLDGQIAVLVDIGLITLIPLHLLRHNGESAKQSENKKERTPK
jgi:hypothetical protein